MKIYQYEKDYHLLGYDEIQLGDVEALGKIIIEEHWRGYIGFFCKKCFHPIIWPHEGIIRDQFSDFTDFLPASNITVKPHFVFNCFNCGHYQEWDGFLDPNITPMLATLNKKGYETEFSCEGHKEASYARYDDDGVIRNIDSYSHPYILFTNRIQNMADVCKHIPLLGPWKAMSDDNVIEDNKFYINVPDENSPLIQNMAWLKRWVDLLPYLDDQGEFHPDMITNSLRERIDAAQQPLTDEELKFEYIHGIDAH